MKKPIAFTVVGVCLLIAIAGCSEPPAELQTDAQPQSRDVNVKPQQSFTDAALQRNKAEVVKGYRKLAHYSYQTAYHSAGQLKRQVKQFLAAPSADSLQQAQQAWRQARQFYSQTEVFRFGNWVVDEWEGKVNAWPIDEGLLDYVQDSYVASATNNLARHNLVANAAIQVGPIAISANTLDWAQLKFLHGAGDQESNVVVGYHAIEFLLWGQDLNRTIPGPGQRPWTDYAIVAEQCTSGLQPAPISHCQRRRQMLETNVEYLYKQLGDMTLSWAGNSLSSYGRHIVSLDTDEGMRRALFGLIRLAGDEMAGERLQVALLSGSPEEEQDCFSDDTHNSSYYNARGIWNVYYGQYPHGDTPYTATMSLADLARAVDSDLADAIDRAMLNTQNALATIQTLGERGETFDLLIRPEHPEGERLITEASLALQQQSQLFEQLGLRLGLQTLNPQAPN